MSHVHTIISIICRVLEPQTLLNINIINNIQNKL